MLVSRYNAWAATLVLVAWHLQQAYAQDLVVRDTTITTAETFLAGSITLGPDVTVTGSGDVLVSAETISVIPVFFVVGGAKIQMVTGGNLPVELTDFSARVTGRNVILAWATASETGNSGFHIEVRSPGTSVFQEVGFVPGAGTSTEPRQYVSTIEKLVVGRHVFRLRQADVDGSFEYSRQVEVAVELATSFALSPVYPNPFNPTATFELAVAQSQDVRVVLADVIGREVAIVFEGALQGQTTHEFRLDASPLASGTYMLSVSGANFRTSRLVTVLK